MRLFAGDAGRKVLMRGMKPMCAKGARSFYLATHKERSRSPLAEAFRAFVEAEAT